MLAGRYLSKSKDAGMLETIRRRPPIASRNRTMPEMMGIVLMAEMLSKDGRRPHEFEELRNRSHPSSGFAAAVKRFCRRWM